MEQLCFTRFASPSSFLPSCATLALTTVGQCMSMALEGTMAPSLFSMFAYTSCRRPLLLLLSSGVDPLTDIQALAEAEGESFVRSFPTNFVFTFPYVVAGMTSGLTIVSLGRGQGTVAARAMRSAARTGGWVLLMNCHLLPSWFNGLEAVFDEVSAGVPHPTFRLLLTSASVDGFPMNLLQSSVRITVEAVSNPSLAIQVRSVVF